MFADQKQPSIDVIFYRTSIVRKAIAD